MILYTSKKQKNILPASCLYDLINDFWSQIYDANTRGAIAGIDLRAKELVKQEPYTNAIHHTTLGMQDNHLETMLRKDNVLVFWTQMASLDQILIDSTKDWMDVDFATLRISGKISGEKIIVDFLDRQNIITDPEKIEKILEKYIEDTSASSENSLSQ